MSKGIDELKDWAMHNVRLISILPSNKNLPVDTKLTDVLEQDVDEKYYLSEEKTSQLVLQMSDKSLCQTDDFMVDDQGRTTKELNPLELSPTLRSESHGNEPRIVKPERKNGAEVGLPIREATKKGYTVAKPGDSVNISFPDSETRRGRVGKQTANTLLTGEEQGVIVKQVEEITNKTRPNEEIGITIKENGDIRPHRMDKRKSGISELNINHENNVSHTVTASHSPKTYGDSTNYRIRKLTPLECWRLQGFTDEQFYKAKNDGVSNSQLYKQAGNSVTVNVIDAIARKLI